MRFAFVRDCGRSLMKTRILFLVVLFACLSGLLSCAGGHSGETYVLISTNIKVPYWQSAGAGWAHAGSQLKVGFAFNGPDTYDPPLSAMRWLPPWPRSPMAFSSRSPIPT